MVDDTPIVSGACLCGTVRFTVHGPANWCVNCHCSMCRRAHGAPWVTWVSFQEEQLKITAGQDQLRHFSSSAAAQRSFCGSCGSPLFFRSPRWANEVHLARACLDDQAALTPTLHAFFSDRAPWHLVADGLARHGGKSGIEPL